MDVLHISEASESLESVDAALAAFPWVPIAITGASPVIRARLLAMLLNRVPKERADRAQPYTDAGVLYVVL